LKIPLYVPLRSQIVSPGCTAAGPESAVCSFHGFVIVPVPGAVLVVPVGDA
jgi:hypothetical protein